MGQVAWLDDEPGAKKNGQPERQESHRAEPEGHGPIATLDERNPNVVAVNNLLWGFEVAIQHGAYSHVDEQQPKRGNQQLENHRHGVHWGGSFSAARRAMQGRGTLWRGALSSVNCLRLQGMLNRRVQARYAALSRSEPAPPG